MIDMPTGTMNLKSVSGAYYASFANTPEGTQYSLKSSDPLISSLNKLSVMGLKAMGTTSATAGGAGTAGVAMIPIYVDPRIVDETRKYTPLVEIIPRVTNLGVTADYNNITAKKAAKFLAEDSPLGDQDDTYDRESVPIKYVYSVGRVTGQARAAYPAYQLEGWNPSGSGLAGTGFTPSPAPNAMQLQVVAKSRTLREEEERVIVNGAITTDVNEFDGIVTKQSTTNTVDKNTSALVYDDIETAVDYAFIDSGRPNLAIAASSVLADIRKLMIDTFRYRPADMTTTLPFGVSSHLTLETMHGPVPVIPQQNMSNTSGSKSIYFLDMNFIEMRVLQDMTFEKLSKNNDSDKFMLKMYEALVMKHTGFNSSITEIS